VRRAKVLVNLVGERPTPGSGSFRPEAVEVTGEVTNW
jgi:hypothetical protein